MYLISLFCQQFFAVCTFFFVDLKCYMVVLAVVQRLHTLVSVTLVLICFVLVIIAVYAGVQVYRWKKKKNVSLDTIWGKFCSKVCHPVLFTHHQRRAIAYLHILNYAWYIIGPKLVQIYLFIVSIFSQVIFILYLRICRYVKAHFFVLIVKCKCTYWSLRSDRIR